MRAEEDALVSFAGVVNDVAASCQNIVGQDFKMFRRAYRYPLFLSFLSIPNKFITPSKACGVCSSAQDFGARIATYATLETESIKCATSYTFSRDFPTLVSCYEALGFTGSCATLWAHFAATNGSECALNCFPDSSGVTEVCMMILFCCFLRMVLRLSISSSQCRTSNHR
jgi:hypothetical protein